MYAGGGALIDRLGTRRGFFVIMVFWSLACASHSLATGFWMLAASRFLLGAGEGGGFPGGDEGHRRVVPRGRALDGDGHRQRRHRGRRGRRAAGDRRDPAVRQLALGLRRLRRGGVAVGIWWIARIPAGRVGPVRRRPATRAGSSLSWTQLLTFRQVWGLVGAKFLTDAAWFFYISWLPKYLYDARGFDVKQVGYYAWVPFAASGIGSLLGGWFSSRLLAQRPVRRLLAQARARAERRR